MIENKNKFNAERYVSFVCGFGGGLGSVQALKDLGVNFIDINGIEHNKPLGEDLNDRK